jgi:hypothetical protein
MRRLGMLSRNPLHNTWARNPSLSLRSPSLNPRINPPFNPLPSLDHNQSVSPRR